MKKQIKKILSSNNCLTNQIKTKLIRPYMINKLLKFPNLIQIETINACNAKCIMCPILKMKRKKEIMSDELYKKIVDEISLNKKYCEHTGLFFNGEPLLDPKIIDRIKYAKEKQLNDVFISTNAEKLTEKMSNNLIKAGLDRIYISLDGTKKETYEKIRVGLHFNNVIENINNLIKCKEKLNSKIVTEIQIIKMEETKQEIDEFKKMWENKIDNIHIKNAHDWAGQTDNEDMNDKRKRKPCPQIWYNFMIYANGKVAICCYDYDGEMIVGDVSKNTIKEIWQGEKFSNYRKQHLNFQFSKLCKTCFNTYYIGDEPIWWY